MSQLASLWMDWVGQGKHFLQYSTVFYKSRQWNSTGSSIIWNSCIIIGRWLDSSLKIQDSSQWNQRSFYLHTLVSSIRADNGIALAVASSGIAALLLEGGRTAQDSRFQSMESTIFLLTI